MTAHTPTPETLRRSWMDDILTKQQYSMTKPGPLHYVPSLSQVRATIDALARYAVAADAYVKLERGTWPEASIPITVGYHSIRKVLADAGWLDD